ncbi:hypothetical protein Cgig2_009896 [Carnegiea gigantea]|uniref:Flowering time control protein FY n=1 Tax=Carnegiea gigantea TaxID=171969 RepID=A0A9Q1QDY6_9CARY|nr:hypothetical protein Cgig2_009896 [Carnegiea gigantea]
MMYGEAQQQQQHQQPPPLPLPLPPPPQQHMHQGPPPPHMQPPPQFQQPGMEFHRGPPPPPPQMMRQPSASSTNLPPDFHHPQPPYDPHADSFAAKRMRKLTQRRAVDYTSTVVRYVQALKSDDPMQKELRPIDAWGWRMILSLRGEVVAKLGNVDAVRVWIQEDIEEKLSTQACELSDLQKDWCFGGKWHGSVCKWRRALPACAVYELWKERNLRNFTQRRSGEELVRQIQYVVYVRARKHVRMWQRDSRDRTALQPTPGAAVDLLPPVAYADNPSTSFTAKFVHTSLNKNRCSINRVLSFLFFVNCRAMSISRSRRRLAVYISYVLIMLPLRHYPNWTPNGRRLITGSQSGEFTLWNGQSFNFEMILQAHEQAVRSMVWSHNENWMVTGDDGGSIKGRFDAFDNGGASIARYWQNNMNNVKANKSAHKESVRDLSFCRTDLKFCSCSDDTTVKVWDFARCQEERSLTGHGWDVKSVDWHPTKSLLVSELDDADLVLWSGGKDNLVKLWDAKSGRELCSFHGHKNTVLCVKWNDNGNWVLTASKDQIIKLYDIRAMKELESFRGHRKDVTGKHD